MRMQVGGGRVKHGGEEGIKHDQGQDGDVENPAESWSVYQDQEITDKSYSRLANHIGSTALIRILDAVDGILPPPSQRLSHITTLHVKIVDRRQR
jgi:hypothetical protein